jgi:2-aminoadipate transaminase
MSETVAAFTLSRAAGGSKSSIIRELLKLANRPEVISFAGGLPSPQGFPIADVKAACEWVMDNNGAHALQYSFTEGEPELRALIAARETANGVPTTPDEVQIVSGSQQALDLVARAFLDAGSKVLVENPTYLGALSAFRLHAPEFVEIATDAEGLDPDSIGEQARGARFAYVMPTFANPSGRTIGEERRERLAQKAREYDFWIVEDDPYGELWYDKRPPASLRRFAPERTLRLGTLSKVLSPGMRLGYIVGPRAFLDVITKLKQAIDLQTSNFTQLIAARVISEGLLETHLPKVRALYKTQAEAMLEALSEYMPKDPAISWTRPSGGMFIWMDLPQHIDTSALMKEGISRNVAFVPGAAFYAKAPENWHCRLSFVTVPREKIVRGVRILADLVAEHLR